MSLDYYLFTSESVAEGHPDKVADQISDAILDKVIEVDKNSHVAAETLLKGDLIVLAGEITTNADIDYKNIALNVIKNIGYTKETGFDIDKCKVMVRYDVQSLEIDHAVTHVKADQGAGDQGIMFGYACDETPSFMPATIYYAHKLMEQHAKLRKQGKLSWLRPDAKTQITARYNRATGKLLSAHDPLSAIDNIILSTQHAGVINNQTDTQKIQQMIKEAVIEEIIKPVIPHHMLKDTQYLINPSGSFIHGGPKADCGLTGRKIIVDTYGGACAHGGGAFSGKDPSKVDRSGAYMARYIAKNIVKSGMARECQVQLAYAIGQAEPVGLHIYTFNSAQGKLTDQRIEQIVKQVFPIDEYLKPHAIITQFNLLQPIYQLTATFGHFGRSHVSQHGRDYFAWERTDKIDELKSHL